MKLTKSQREDLRNMFDGRCAYCGCPLGEKWHADHVVAVRRDGYYESGKWKLNGKMERPENDQLRNLFPACIACNLLKSTTSVEDFRKTIQHICITISSEGSHIRHLLRFGKCRIDATPVVFYFESYGNERTGAGG